MWYVSGRSTQIGPLSSAQLGAMLSAGEVADGSRLHTLDGTSVTWGEVKRWQHSGDDGLGAMAETARGVKAKGAVVDWPWRRGDPQPLWQAGFAILIGGMWLASTVRRGRVEAVDVVVFAVVAAALYGAFVFFRNRTRLRVRKTSVVVSHGPLPGWRPGVTVPLGEVREVFVDGAGKRWRVVAGRWRAPSTPLLQTREAGDALKVLRALAAEMRRRGAEPMVSESPAQRVAQLLGLPRDESKRSAPAEVAVPEGTRPEVSAPVVDGIEVERRGSTLTVSRRWRSRFWVGMFAVWLFPIVVLPLAALADGKPLHGGFVVGAIILAIGYTPIAFMVNRTRWELTGTRLRIRHGPLPVPGFGSRDLDLERATQIYCKDRARYRHPYRSLEVLLADGSSETLWSFNINVVPDAQVVAVERHLEDALGIVDRPVAGEVQRG